MIKIYGLIICLVPLLLFAQKRPMTTDDGLNMVNLGGAKIAPDASRILFTKSELDWEKNKRKSKHYSVSPQGGDEYQFLGGESDSDIKFSPDGKYITFKRSVEKKSQVFLMRTNGGEAVQWSKHPESVSSYEWAPDSKSIFFLANEEKSKEQAKEEKDGYDHVYIDEGPNGQRKASWRHLFQQLRQLGQ